jgi:hypothetical protein
VHERDRIVGVGLNQGYEDKVLHTRVPRCPDEVPVAFQVNALRVVRAAAHSGIGRIDYSLYAFNDAVQGGAVAQVPMNRLCPRLDQLLG